MFAAATMSLDPVLELSVEQLIKALNEKLFMECKRTQLAIPSISRGSAAQLTSEVRTIQQTADESASVDMMFRRLMLWRNEPKTFFTK